MSLNVNEIPLICPNFNQLSFLKNLINQWQFYYPNNPIVIIDNGSNYEPLLEYYETIGAHNGIRLIRCIENEFIKNLSAYLTREEYEYYVISDCDISIHPTTPPNFLDYFKAVIDAGYHRCGFDLIYDDIPDWNPKKGWIQGDQKELHGETVDVHGYQGYKAPIDTTFCLYSSKNGGWQAPMDGKNWGNCVRLFKAFHLTWYLHKDYMNEEMTHYFSSVKKRDNSKPSAGVNHFNPINGFE